MAHVLVLNIGCIGLHVTKSLMPLIIKMTSVFFKMGDVSAVCFQVNLNVLKHWQPKVCMKKIQHEFDAAHFIVWFKV